MLWVNFKRVLRTGFIGFWRNGVVSLSAVLIMSITLMIIASVLFMSALLNHTLVSLQNRVDVNINMVTSATEESVIKLKETLETLPEVQSVEYISSDQSLENFRARHADDERTLAALDELDENPLGAALNVRAVSPEHYEGIQTFIDQNYAPGEGSIIETVNYAQKKAAIDKLNLIISSGQKFGVIVTVIFVILSIMITLNTIRLAIFISKDEIHLMKLVGAEKNYISGPFAVTGAMYGIISALFVLIILYPLTWWLGPEISPIFFDLNIFSYYISNFGQMFLIIFVSGIVIGTISSFLAISRYLKK